MKVMWCVLLILSEDTFYNTDTVTGTLGQQYVQPGLYKDTNTDTDTDTKTIWQQCNKN